MTIRRHEDDRLDRIEQYLEALKESHDHLEQRMSLRKNGDTWPQYLGKVFTIDRLMLLVVLIYQFGGQVQMFKSDVSGIVKREASVVKQQEELTAQIGAYRALQNDQGQVVMDLMSETNRLSKVSRELDDRISRTVTRGEFKSAVDQQLVPRLTRIEKTLKLDSQ